MESQLKNPEFRINPENFHPCRQPQRNSNKAASSLFLSKVIVNVDMTPRTTQQNNDQLVNQHTQKGQQQ